MLNKIGFVSFENTIMVFILHTHKNDLWQEKIENENKKDEGDEGSKGNEGFCFEKDKEEKREKTYSHNKTCLLKQHNLLEKSRKRHKEEESEEEKENKVSYINCAAFDINLKFST